MYQKHLEEEEKEEGEEEEEEDYEKEHDEEEDVCHIKHLFMSHKINHYRVCHSFVLFN
jgi:hypothetical protein